MIAGLQDNFGKPYASVKCAPETRKLRAEVVQAAQKPYR